jgi:hypothetical protein
MPEPQSFKIGDRVTLTDIADAPDGAWVVRETMQFLRAQAGHSIVSLTPIEGGTVAVNKIPSRFTLVYAGPYQIEKSVGVADALNNL